MKGILFDLDGTLMDTLQDLADATNHALHHFGFPGRSLEEVRRAVGNGAATQLRRCLPEGTDEETADRVVEFYKPWYADHCRNHTKPYEGILQALEYLAVRYPVAIVSNKPDAAVKTLCSQWFPGIYALGEKTDCPRKPAADMVLRAMADIGVTDCVYVGDSEVDVLTAKNAGVDCICVLWGFRDRELLEQAGGRYFCETPDNLAEMIEERIHGQ